MESLTKDDLVTCASALLDKPDVDGPMLALVSRLLDIASAMPEASEQTETALKELIGMLHPSSGAAEAASVRIDGDGPGGGRDARKAAHVVRILDRMPVDGPVGRLGGPSRDQRARP